MPSATSIAGSAKPRQGRSRKYIVHCWGRLLQPSPSYISKVFGITGRIHLNRKLQFEEHIMIHMRDVRLDLVLSEFPYPFLHGKPEVYVMKRVSLLLVIALCFFMAGCGSKAGGSYTVSGRITKIDDPQQGLEGVTIAFSGGHGTATTDASGNWRKTGLNGPVTLTPAKEGWAFDPPSKQVTKAASNVDFAASAYMVYGRVTRQDNGQGLEGVRINFSGGFIPVATAPDGTWFKIGLKGVITVTPTKDGWAFDPPSRQVIETANDVDFVAGAYTVSGRVTRNDNGQGLGGVTISFSEGFSPAVTAPDGTWSKSGLNGRVTVTPTKEGWAFSPWSTVVVTTASTVDFDALEAFPITFDDPNLEAAVRQEIMKYTGQLMNTDVMNLLFLHAGSLNISRLGGIQYLVNLEYLYLGHNQISDISLLGGLTNLNSLSLRDNQISDISPLEGLMSIEFLGLGENEISDISVLAGLTNIRQLGIWRNKISDISAIAGLTNLEHLDAVVNEISDISPLVANSGLGDGDSIDVRCNQLDLSPGSDAMQDINTLIQRGVSVTYKPQGPDPLN
jgi:hypothetical protein